jgi:hypothetical protein
VGRHAAGSAGPPHPLVAAALARRPSGRGPRHLGTEGPVGWPGPPNPAGGRQGWPEDAADDGAGDGAEAAEEPAPAGRAA